MTDRAPAPGPDDFRACGLALLKASEAFESSLVTYEAGPATLAIIGLIARARRLLRSSYRLADADDRLEAMILVRTLLEYQITLRWLILDPDLHFLQWALADLKSRMRVDAEMRELGDDVMTHEARSSYQEHIAQLEAGIGDRPQRYPSLEQRAKATGNEAAYSLAYRFDSQTAAHPSAFALEQLFEDRPEHGGIAVLDEPPASRGYADPYAVAAYTLLDMLEAPRAGLREMKLGPEFDEIARRLQELRGAGQAWYGGQPRPS